MTDLMDERIQAAARRWQAELPPPPAVPLERLGERLPGRRLPWRPLTTAAAAVLVVAGGASMIARVADSSSPHPATGPSTSGTLTGHQVVPWRALPAGHPDVRHRVGGEVVTPYDRLSATGHISGHAHPGDTVLFTAVLESSTTIPLSPCPDFTIAFGTTARTWRLNCAQVPFHDGQGRPVLPAFTNVRFAMQVTVPDEPGRQKVLWTLDGPQRLPGFYGLVDVQRP
ncbi:hypothetical protein [Nocardioides cynanchi]|uniref:hypothetical protein n=1 Tax=Nocardioides cynanchi TaxID=2558918 RepID=UPI0012451BCC|nr:hypothetical protein [Nocardioides cynanchi]